MALPFHYQTLKVTKKLIFGGFESGETAAALLQ